MTATPKKPQAKAGPPKAGPLVPAASATDRTPAAGEKTFFRLRNAADTLGTPSDTAGVTGADPAGATASEGGLISRWLRGAPASPRPPRRRSPPPAASPNPPADVAEPVTGTIIEPDQEAPGPDAVESYRSASDLTEPEAPPKSKFVA